MNSNHSLRFPVMTAKPSVLVTRNDVPEAAMNRLRQECDVEVYPHSHPIPRDVLLRSIGGKNGLLCFPREIIDEELLDAAGKSLKVVSTISSGYDHFISLNEMKIRGIKACNTPRVCTESTAELAVGLLIAASRRFFEAHNEIVNGGWAKAKYAPTWMLGQGLSGSTVGIFGLGGIGQSVIKKLQGFNVEKFIYNSRSRKKEENELSAIYVSFDDLLRQSDFLVITCSLTDETKGIFNKEAFAKMKKTVILINVSRGGLIDQTALIEALKSDQIQGAGLDVMSPEPLPLDHPLLTTPNLTLLPHIGTAERNSRTSVALFAVENIISALKGEKTISIV